jgi:hypothetical protein
MPREELMSYTNIIVAVCFLLISIFPALASEVSTLKPGEAIILMPDGRISIVQLNKPAINMQLKSGLKRLGNCTMLMATADGSVWVVDTERQKPRSICEEMAQ